MKKTPYQQYCHVIAASYRQYGIADETVRDTLSTLSALAGGTPEDMVRALLPGIKDRLGLLPLPLDSQILEDWFVRSVDFGGVRILIPILNEQGREWYGTSPIDNYDFLIERNLGLLDDCRTIFDFGGHHGVWAAYYANIVGPGGVVYSFEPSLINFEISSLLYLINDLDNIVSTAAAVGTHTSHAESHSSSEDMLVDFVEGQIRVVDLQSISWHRADFIKMDIEGFEFDIITVYPWIFDLAEHLHIELHIPHLVKRGLDYRKVMDLIPFDRFEVVNAATSTAIPLERNSELEGYCSLMLKRRQ